MSRPTRMDCAETFKRLADYLDLELTPEETKMVEEHLAACAVCASEYGFEVSLLRQLKAKARDTKLPEDVRLSVLNILNKARAEAG